MNLRFVSSFVATADLGSFSKAAESLFSTQATIASRVAKLEEELGVPLFLRDGSSLVLTDHGHAALPVARRLLACATEFSRAAGGEAVEGVIRIAVTDYVAHLLGAGFLSAAHAVYPGLQFEIYTQSSPTVIERLEEGRIDIGVLVGTEVRPALVCRHLFDLSLRWIVTAENHLPDVRGLDALKEQAIISYPVGTLPYQAIERQLETLQPRPRTLAWLDSVHAVLSAVRAGLGAAMIAPALVEEDIVAGRLVVLDAPPALESLTFHAHFRENARRTLCETLVQIMGDHLMAKVS